MNSARDGTLSRQGVRTNRYPFSSQVSPGVRNILRTGKLASAHHKISAVILGAVLGLSAGGASAHAQTGAGNVTLVASESLFDVFAAINAAGYDTGLGSEPPSSLRLKVRDWCLRRSPAALPAIAKFYHEQNVGDAAVNLGQYVSLALFLGPPPDFKLTVADSDLPPDAAALKGLVPLLSRFYREADLGLLWTRIQPEYDRRIAELSEPVRHTIAITDAYLRFPSGAYLGRTYAIDLCPLGAPEQVQARIYGENYYVVMTRSAEPPIKDIRHQYLHFLLDPLAVKYAFELHQKQPLAALARPAPALGADFKEDFSFLVTECLIRAVELRMDKPARPQEAVDNLTRQGLILVPYFYGVLADYEAQASAMGTFYRQMILGITLKTERQRLANVKFAPAGSLPAPAGHVTAPVDPRQAQLDEGDNLIFEGKYDEARTVFASVTAADPHNERALFGLAVVASNTRKPDTAEDYLKQTLQVARSLRIVTWSHIYLGRLYDLEGRRKQGLEQYQAAAVTATGFPDAFRAVQSGLAQPFGSAPQQSR